MPTPTPIHNPPSNRRVIPLTGRGSGSGRRDWRVGTTWAVGFALVLMGLLSVSVKAPASRAAEVTDTQVKAVWILNFAKYVEWPAIAFADAQSPILVGLVGEDPILKDLEAVLASATAKNRRLKLAPVRNEADLKACHIVFMGASEGKRGKAGLLKTLKDWPVLTIGESGTFTEDGGIIRFLMVNNTVRFDINLNAANAAGLSVSSKVVAVAHTVVGKNNVKRD